jgi:hypothetical protein
METPHESSEPGRQMQIIAFVAILLWVAMLFYLSRGAA